MSTRVKTGGRKKGTPNKRTVWLRDALSDVEFSWEEEFKNAYASSDFARLHVLTALLPYLAPKIKEREAVDADSTESTESLHQTQSNTSDILSIVQN
jgi:hypothetical protein